jgi:hypothetical protein
MQAPRAPSATAITDGNFKLPPLGRALLEMMGIGRLVVVAGNSRRHS